MISNVKIEQSFSNGVWCLTLTTLGYTLGWAFKTKSEAEDRLKKLQLDWNICHVR